MLAGPTNSSPPARLVCWGVFLITLTLLLALRWPILFMPLYEDQSVGFGREADFLHQTNFDYYKLRYEEKHFMFGGTARSYMVSAIPTLLALLRRLTGSVESTLFVWHLASFLLAAGSATLTTAILLRFVGVIDALLVTAALFSTPMLLAQADVAGMELPLVFFSLLTIRSLLRDQYLLAIAFGILAFFMKASGLLPFAAALAVIVLRFLLGDRRHRLAWAILSGTVSLAGLVALLAWGDDTALFRATFHWPSAFRLPAAIYWCPDLAVLLLVVVCLAISSCYLRWAHPSQAQSFRSWLNQPAVTLGLWAGLILIGSIASMQSYIFIPRYYILPLVAIYLIIGLLLASWPILTRVGSAIILLILIVNLFNHAGSLYPPVARFAGRDLNTSPSSPPVVVVSPNEVLSTSRITAPPSTLFGKPPASLRKPPSSPLFLIGSISPRRSSAMSTRPPQMSSRPVSSRTSSELFATESFSRLPITNSFSSGRKNRVFACQHPIRG